jgi:NADPH:quinone reductase-like Zn-dependent oxidoreductase
VGPDFVLVIARGASVNPVDAKVVAATWTGLLRALPLLPGWDVAGTAEAAAAVALEKGRAGGKILTVP